MSGPDLIHITDNRGQTAWVHRPPGHCPNGHPFRPGDIQTYAESWFSCWCDNAQAAGERPGHNSYRCKTCDAVTLVPECSDPTMKTGWAASHGHGAASG
jgi:hypothetical protein